MEEVKGLVVKYNGKVVGYLRDIEDGQIAFQYDNEWIKTGFSISPFSLPLSNKIYINQKDTFDGLFGVFWDSLPDGWGELLIRRMLSKQGINLNKLTPLQKLALVRDNGLGALTYEPSKQFESENFELDLDKLAMDAQKVLNDDCCVDLDTLYHLGGSSGGTRPKAHMKLGAEEWIVKFPCLIDPKNIGEQEYKANKLAKDCGINVNEFKLFDSNLCSGYFGAKRFDRKGDKRVHMISLAAILETTHRIANLDYGYLFRVVENICVDKEELYEAFRRMCFNVFYKNRDDHSKNFVFIYDEDKKTYKLSPAYDLTPTPNKPEHEVTVMGNGLPTEQDLLELAKNYKLNLSRCEEIIKKIKSVLYS